MIDYQDITPFEDDIPDWSSNQDEESETESGTDINTKTDTNGNTNTGTSNTDQHEPLGKCPHCGGDVIYGQYGAYCKSKCGMSIGKVFKKNLTEEEARELLTNGKVYLENMISKEGKEYSAYFIPDGIEEYSYTNKDGQTISGQYRYKFKIEFPKKDSKDNKEETHENNQ